MVPGPLRWGLLLVYLRDGLSSGILGWRLCGWICRRLRGWMRWRLLHWGGGAVTAYVPFPVALEALDGFQAWVGMRSAWGHDFAALRTLSGAYPV